MVRRIKNSLLAQMAGLAAVIFLFLVGTLTFTDRYTGKLIKENTLELNEKILLQVDDKIEEFVSNMTHIAESVAYSPTGYQYFLMSETERVLAEPDMTVLFSNAAMLEPDIIGISFYDSDMNRLSEYGETPGSHGEMKTLHTKMEFGNLFTRAKEEKECYQIFFPVYDLNSSVYGVQIGMCVFLMRTDNFREMMEDAQTTEHSGMYVLDASSHVVASNKNVPSVYMPQKLKESTASYYVQQRESVISGWQIVERIPERELYQSKDGMKGFVLAAYGISALIAVLLIGFCYCRLIAPVRRLDTFIRDLVEHPRERITVSCEDEIGLVAASLNQMLDDLQRVNEEIQVSQKKMYETELARKQLQLIAYRNQINPHFLYNTFECIRAMALYYEVDDIAEITMALSNVFRFAVKGDNIVTVEEEINYIREYAKIIDYRFMGKIGVAVNVDPGIQKNKVIKLMLQPLVENAVFHGLEQKMEPGDVTVTVKRYEDHRMVFTVEDDGCGMEPSVLERLRSTLDQKTEKKGVGVSNIYQRLRLYYGDDMEFRIESSLRVGTRITIIIPDHVENGGIVHV